MAPVMSAGVMIANIIWKMANSIEFDSAGPRFGSTS